ncbi:hypothetical protein, partial [Rufibacter ruber]|uniref:hypothetical protein n=1 Tax=Rufibacter ruber TaxID=1783499 RepID=UPI000A8EFF4B
MYFLKLPGKGTLEKYLTIPCLLFSGCFSPYRDWFLSNTPLNLVLATALLFWNHQGLTVRM